MRFLDKLNTPKVFVITLALVLAVNGLLFLVHNYRLAENTATASPPAKAELDATKSSSIEATPTENSEEDNSGKQEQAGTKEAAGAVSSPASKKTDGFVAREAEPQSSPSLDSNTPPPLNQPAVYPTPAVTEEPTESPTIPTTYPEPLYDSNI